MTSRLIVAFAFAFLCLASLNAQAQAAPEPLTTIAALDVPRYMGTWYEISRYPNWFQKKCVGNTKAEYSIQADGRVQVVNRCTLENGESSLAIGTARQLGAATSPKLEVRFAPAWLSFIPAVWGDYWVIDLDDQYQLAAVSDAKRKYLWILSRTPRVEQKTYEALIGRLARKGFDVKALELTRQDR